MRLTTRDQVECVHIQTTRDGELIQKCLLVSFAVCHLELSMRDNLFVAVQARCQLTVVLDKAQRHSVPVNTQPIQDALICMRYT
jgi:hypothetical protein